MAAPDGPAGAVPELLLHGELAVQGRMPYSSNGTFLVTACHRGATGHAVYKPVRGERPLADFPAGLHRRERAAFLLSEALGWDLVPTTVLRDGPLGEGSVQALVDADLEQHYFTLLEDPAHHATLRRLALFDLLANSTDRKGGHVLVDRSGRLWAIDNGLTFHAQFKLRTVIWDFAGDAIDEHLLDDLRALLDAGVPPRVAELIGVFERDALLTRARALVREGVLPHDPTGRRYPWPLV